MQQLEIFSLPNPCIGVCQVNNQGYCQGCWRSRQERQSWQQLTNSNKVAVLALAKQRRLRYLRSLLASKQPAPTQELQEAFNF